MGNCCDSKETNKPMQQTSLGVKKPERQNIVADGKIVQIENSQAGQSNHMKKASREIVKSFRVDDDQDDDEIFRERPILQQTPEFNHSNLLVSNKATSNIHLKKSTEIIQMALKAKNKTSFQIDEEADNYKINNFEEDLKNLKGKDSQKEDFKKQTQQLISIKDISGLQSQKSLIEQAQQQQIQISIQSENQIEDDVVNEVETNSQLQQEGEQHRQLPYIQTPPEASPKFMDIDQIEFQLKIPNPEYIQEFSNNNYLQDIPEESKESSLQYIPYNQDKRKDILELKVFKKLDSSFLKKMNQIYGDPEENERNYHSLQPVASTSPDIQKSQSVKISSQEIDLHGNMEKNIYKKFDPNFLYQLASSFGFSREIKKDPFYDPQNDEALNFIFDRPTIQKKKNKRSLERFI